MNCKLGEYSHHPTNRGTRGNGLGTVNQMTRYMGWSIFQTLSNINLYHNRCLRYVHWHSIYTRTTTPLVESWEFYMKRVQFYKQEYLTIYLALDGAVRSHWKRNPMPRSNNKACTVHTELDPVYNWRSWRLWYISKSTKSSLNIINEPSSFCQEENSKILNRTCTRHCTQVCCSCSCCCSPLCTLPVCSWAHTSWCNHSCSSSCNTSFRPSWGHVQEWSCCYGNLLQVVARWQLLGGCWVVAEVVPVVSLVIWFEGAVERWGV